MQKFKFCCLLLSSLLLLGSCGGSNSLSSSDDESSTSTEALTTSISDVRSASVGDVVTTKGVVVAYNYTGQSTPYKTGIWIADEAASIYVYSQELTSMVDVGNQITIKGELAYYIPTNDVSSAGTINYKGMLQLINISLLEKDDICHEIPSGSINESTIEQINAIPLDSDITGNIYHVKGRYYMYDNTSYKNYEVFDLNRVDSLLAYTQSNGKDYAWSDDYNGKTVDMLIIVSIGKPSVSKWRMCPIKFLADDVVVSDKEEATYSAKRCLTKFENSYNKATNVDIPLTDPLMSSISWSISSSSSKVSITSDTDKTTVSFQAVTSLENVSINAMATYGTSSFVASKSISLEVASTFNTISISEALASADGTNVLIQGVVARLTYKGSMVKQGMFLVDDSGSCFIYNDTATQANLDGVSAGNKVVVSGTMTHFIKNADNATAENYSGDRQICNVEIKDIDKNNYSMSTASISDSTIETIAATLPSNNITGNIYKVTCVVNKSSGSYGSYTLNGVTDSSKGVPLYSQNNATDFDSLLSTYIGKTVIMYLGIQNLNLKSSGSFYRGCPISIISEVGA